MYNLLVSSNPKHWLGDSWKIEMSRCVREYTDIELTKRYGDLESQAKAVLCKLPCIFAYEAGTKLPPKFGIIKDIAKRQGGEVRIEYEIQDVDPFLSAKKLYEHKLDLDIGEWELSRTHWALKEVNLARELLKLSIRLPSWVQSISRSVDVSSHKFDVALSFPGEARGLVGEVVKNLEPLVGPNAYFYDNNFTAQLARPALDTLLQDIYKNRSLLIVLFVGGDYQRKEWCGIEFRAIREIINERDYGRIMIVRMDDGLVEGILKSDGYIDARKYEPGEIAQFIHERVQLLKDDKDG